MTWALLLCKQKEGSEIILFLPPGSIFFTNLLPPVPWLSACSTQDQAGLSAVAGEPAWLAVAVMEGESWQRSVSRGVCDLVVPHFQRCLAEVCSLTAVSCSRHSGTMVPCAIHLCIYTSQHQTYIADCASSNIKDENRDIYFFICGRKPICPSELKAQAVRWSQLSLNLYRYLW